MKARVASLLLTLLATAGCAEVRYVESYSEFAVLTYRIDERSGKPVAAADGTTTTQFIRDYTLKNTSPMPMHVRVPPIAVIQRVNSAVSQISQNRESFSDFAKAFGEDRTITLEPGEEYEFEVAESWGVVADLPTTDNPTTFVFGLPEKRPQGLELLGEVRAIYEDNEP